MEDYNALYKISYQLMLNTVINRNRYDEALKDLGEDDKITKYYKQQLADAEEAVKIFNDLIERMQRILEGGEADDQ